MWSYNQRHTKTDTNIFIIVILLQFPYVGGPEAFPRKHLDGHTICDKCHRTISPEPERKHSVLTNAPLTSVHHIEWQSDDIFLTSSPSGFIYTANFEGDIAGHNPDAELHMSQKVPDQIKGISGIHFGGQDLLIVALDEKIQVSTISYTTCLRVALAEVNRDCFSVLGGHRSCQRHKIPCQPLAYYRETLCRVLYVRTIEIKGSSKCIGW